MSDEEQNSFTKSVMESMTTDAPAKEPVKQEPKPVEQEPKPVEQESEPKAEDDLKGFSDEQKTNWKALRESKKDIEKRYKESEATRTDLVAQLDQLKADLAAAKQSFDVEEFDRLKVEREELVNQLAELDILRSPEVKRARDNVKATIDNAVKSIRRLLPEQTGFDRILGMNPEARDKALQELLEDASPSVASRVWQLVDKVDSAQQQVDEITTMAEGRLDEWKQSKQQEVEVRKQTERKQTEQLYHLGLQAAQEEMPELFALKDGDDTHNKQVSERLAYVKQQLFEPFDESDAVKHAFYGAVGKTAITTQKLTLEALAKSEAERQSLKEKLAAYESAEPGGSFASNEGGGSQRVEPGYFANTVLANFQ